MSEAVHVLGVGQTAFGEDDRPLPQIASTAVARALDDAGISADAVEAGFLGNVGGPADPHRSVLGQTSLREVGITGVSVMNVENACSSSACAHHLGYMAVTSGQHDVVVVFGAEKMRGVSTADATEALGMGGDVYRESMRGLTTTSIYGMRANAYRAAYDVPDFRRALAEISVKNHHNAVSNPYAQFSKEITTADVLESPLIADPLRLYDVCPTTDGAAALVIGSDRAVDVHDPPAPVVTVDGSVHTTGRYDHDDDLATLSGLARTADRAYDQAGVRPDDIDVWEVHDAATMGELMRCEALGVFEEGAGCEAVLAGESRIGGSAPVNPSGGLKARGHPIGATGVAQLAEIVWQLRGEADGRQVTAPTVGVAQNAGGFINGVSANNTVTVLSTN